MNSRVYKTEGLVLSRRDLGEADRIINIFTKNFGKLTLLAKGIKKPKSRKRGHLEVFSRVNITASKSRGMDIMTEADVVDTYSEIRKNLKKVSLAYYFVEVVNKITKEEEMNIRFYNLLLNYFEKLKSDEPLKSMRLDFVYNTLVCLGYWPSGTDLGDADLELENVLERKIYSVRVGKKVLL